MDDDRLICPSRTPRPLGQNDQADPDRWSMPGITPGPMGVADYSTLVCDARTIPVKVLAVQPPAQATSNDPEWEAVVSGSILVGAGLPSAVRIPVPNTGGLHIEFFPRGWTPKTGSTSTFFVQDAVGKRKLRIDFGFNKTTGKIDYHWNQQKVFKEFQIPNHSAAGAGGKVLYQAAKYYRYAGRALLIVAAAADIYSIVIAKKRLRQVVTVASGWAVAWVGCKVVGAGGAKVGTLAEPGLGTAVGGIAGCIVGGTVGYFGGSALGSATYDYVEETFFESVPEEPGPAVGTP